MECESVTMEDTVFSPTGGLILNGLCHSLRRLGADLGLLTIVGSWGDSLSEDRVLRMIEEYNAKRQTALSTTSTHD